MILFDKKLQLENKYTENGYHKNNDKKAAQTAEWIEYEKYKVCDEHEIKSLTVPEENTKIQLDFGDISFCFYAIDSEDARRYLDITKPEYQERRFLLSELAERFPKKDLAQLSREEAIKICELLFEDGSQFVYFLNSQIHQFFCQFLYICHSCNFY